MPIPERIKIVSIIVVSSRDGLKGPVWLITKIQLAAIKNFPSRHAAGIIIKRPAAHCYPNTIDFATESESGLELHKVAGFYDGVIGHRWFAQYGEFSERSSRNPKDFQSVAQHLYLAWRFLFQA